MDSSPGTVMDTQYFWKEQWAPVVPGKWYTAVLLSTNSPIKEKPQEAPINPKFSRKPFPAGWVPDCLPLLVTVENQREGIVRPRKTQSQQRTATKPSAETLLYTQTPQQYMSGICIP
ncbi:hypothetical protein DSO57_1001723 [Entomophthora muscae]|uniref:Uncharacterized protein n=1 Tax=Entomophthora muscae TaxID=34485 RepID=A0ACC2SLT3_9FUNG|nr:hypothetical protein DSO57_1001723 [Entomophthora muscae]